MILTGHRDTHFHFLKDVRPDDRLELTGTDGTTIHYRVTEQRVLDSRRGRAADGTGQSGRDLCHPAFHLTPSRQAVRYVT